jgi:hypothetical protein
MELPADLKESLSELDYVIVVQWWDSLSSEQQCEYTDVAEMAAEDFDALIGLEDIDPAPEMRPYYDYLVNHELRCVQFLDEVGAKSSYKILSAYVASLGADYRHGESGTVG